MTTYADESELARILKIRNPTTEQTAAMTRVLTMATVEIDDYLDREDTDPVVDDALALAEQVCLQRATELWGLQEVPLGLAGIGSEFGSAHLARDSWEKYTFTLYPLKRGYGIA
jgi:hypothetical protein